MSDRIDPGPGYRLLAPGEMVRDGDETLSMGIWAPLFGGGHNDGRLSGRWYEELTELSRMAIDRLIADGERLAR